MNQFIKKILFVLIISYSLISIISCEKEIEVELETVEDKLVVEGIIETGEYPYITLSKSTGYFEPVDSTTFYKMFVNDALVIVSDGSQYDTLKFDTVPFYPPFRFQGSKIIGQENTTYNLRIEYEGQVYTSTTTIRQIIPLDSVKYIYEANSDSLGRLRLYANDPIDQTNYYKGFSRDLDIDLSKELPIWVHPGRAVTNDKFFNGKLVEATMYNGWNPLKGSDYYEEHSEDWWSFKMGDHVLVKLSHIDYDTYMYWRTTEDVMYNGDNPFAAPTSVQSNIYPKDKALGSWCGHAISLYELTITEDIVLYEPD